MDCVTMSRIAGPSVQPNRDPRRRLFYCESKQAFVPEISFVRHAVLLAPFNCPRISGVRRPAKPIGSSSGVFWQPKTILKAARVKEHAARITLFSALPKQIRSDFRTPLNSLPIHIEHPEV